MNEQSLYIIDTSSLVDLYKWRPQRRHRAVWEKLGQLIEADRLISPDEVYEEIQKETDALARWALRLKRSRQLFTRTTQQHARIAKEIVRKFPDLIELDRPGQQADPFVVALAVFESRRPFVQKCVVLTQEKYTPTGRPRIPHICEAYKLPYMSIHQMYVSEGWAF